MGNTVRVISKHWDIPKNLQDKPEERISEEELSNRLRFVIDKIYDGRVHDFMLDYEDMLQATPLYGAKSRLTTLWEWTESLMDEYCPHEQFA